jgi:hypothetical protein
MVRGCLALATLWESAWHAGKGEEVPDAKLAPVKEAELVTIYEDRAFVPPLYMPRMMEAGLGVWGPGTVPTVGPGASVRTSLSRRPGRPVARKTRRR